MDRRERLLRNHFTGLHFSQAPHNRKPVRKVHRWHPAAVACREIHAGKCSIIGADPASECDLHKQQQQAKQQTMSPRISNSNLNSITIDAYNSPQFREMLEQLTKPLTIPPETINYPPEWPSQDKISNFLNKIQTQNYKD